jgi:hypothetical protein
MKRVGQALQVRLEIDRLFAEAEQAGDPAPLIAVCGDFNAESDEVPLQAICGQVEDTGNPAHGPRVLVACENQVAESARYSLFHLGRGEMVDHVLLPGRCWPPWTTPRSTMSICPMSRVPSAPT